MVVIHGEDAMAMEVRTQETVRVTRALVAGLAYLQRHAIC